MLVHLMPASSSLGKARRAERCDASFKRRNTADGKLAGTRWAGLFCLLTALACACGGQHHGAQAALSADKSDPVK